MKNCSKCSKWGKECGCSCSNTRQQEEEQKKVIEKNGQLQEGVVKICPKKDCNCAGCTNCSKE